MIQCKTIKRQENAENSEDLFGDLFNATGDFIEGLFSELNETELNEFVDLLNATAEGLNDIDWSELFGADSKTDTEKRQEDSEDLYGNIIYLGRK